MPLNRINAPTPSAPTGLVDYEATNNWLAALALATAGAERFDALTDKIPDGTILIVGNSLYRSDGDTTITGTRSDYVRIVPSGATATANYQGNLSGVAWNSVNQGYYAGNNLYLFDEALAYFNGQITTPKTTLGKITKLKLAGVDFSGANVNAGNFTGNRTLAGTTTNSGTIITNTIIGGRIQNSTGGFSGGQGSGSDEGGGAIGMNAVAVGNGAGGGGAVGNGASSVFGGGAVGNKARTTWGGAVGNGATAKAGGAIGEDSKSGGGSFAGGLNASADFDNSVALGKDATCTRNREQNVLGYFFVVEFGPSDTQDMVYNYLFSKIGANGRGSSMTNIASSSSISHATSPDRYTIGWVVCHKGNNTAIGITLRLAFIA